MSYLSFSLVRRNLWHSGGRMFGSGKNREISRLRDEVEVFEITEARLRTEIETLSAEYAALQIEKDQFQSRSLLLDGMSGPLNQFADSAKALQGSLAAMALRSVVETAKTDHLSQLERMASSGENDPSILCVGAMHK